MEPIYLDNNSTTIVHPEVVQAMNECYAAGHVNPASQHEPGRRARSVLEEARDGIGRILGAQIDSHPTDRIIFTSGGTESNNLALRGLAGTGGEILVSAVEHPSVFDTAAYLSQSGSIVHILPVDAQGVVGTRALGERLNAQTRCVSVMLGNNETGVLQPVDEIVRICADWDVPVHTDAVQVVGKIPVAFRDLGVAALTATAHKLHGPHGIGVLLVRDGVPLNPLLLGGPQQLGTRPGTEPLALVVGMWRALEIWQREAAVRQARMTRLRDRLEHQLIAALPESVINGAGAERLPHTLNVSFPGLDRQALFLALDQQGIACSTGSACASGSSEPSPVLMAMGCPKSVLDSSLRISLSARTTEQEVQRAAEMIVQIVQQMQVASGRRKPPLAAREPT